MWNDVSVQPCLTCGTFADRIVEIDLWMSGGGSKSLLHKVQSHYKTLIVIKTHCITAFLIFLLNCLI